MTSNVWAMASAASAGSTGPGAPIAPSASQRCSAASMVCIRHQNPAVRSRDQVHTRCSRIAVAEVRLQRAGPVGEPLDEARWHRSAMRPALRHRPARAVLGEGEDRHVRDVRRLRQPLLDDPGDEAVHTAQMQHQIGHRPAGTRRSRGAPCARRRPGGRRPRTPGSRGGRRRRSPCEHCAGVSPVGQERQHHVGHLVRHLLGEVVPGVEDMTGDVVGHEPHLRPRSGRR